MSLSKPILAVIALSAFTAAYSNFMFALLLCQDRNTWTLMVWIYQLQMRASEGVVLAALTLAAIPTLLVFVLCQRQIIQGIVVPVEK
jgi:multiple sugar transport system permease protein